MARYASDVQRQVNVLRSTIGDASILQIIDSTKCANELVVIYVNRRFISFWVASVSKLLLLNMNLT